MKNNNEGLFMALVMADATRKELVEMMMCMKKARESPKWKHVVLMVGGYDDDPREIFEIPEVRDLCRRMIEIGFISYLDYATTLPWSSEDVKGGYGALEVWLTAEGKMASEAELSTEWLITGFKDIVDDSNMKADTLLGPLKLSSDSG